MEDITWINTPEAAKLVGLSGRHLCELARSGRFPLDFARRRAYDGKRRGWLFNKAALEQYRADPRQFARENREHITFHEAAAILDRTFATVVLYVAQGKLTPIPPGTVPPEERVWAAKSYLRRADVEALLAKGLGRPARPDVEPIAASAADCAWLAGFFDGEGCVNVSHIAGKQAWSMGLQISNTFIPVVEQIQVLFGGRLCYREGAAAGHRPKCIWFAHSDHAMAVLQAMLPYLRVKRDQAEVAIELQMHIRAHHYSWYDLISPEDAAWRDERRLKIQELNGRQFPLPEDRKHPVRGKRAIDRKEG